MLNKAGPAEATKDCSDHPSQKLSWGSGGAVSPQWVQSDALVGVQGEPPEAPEISSFLTFKIPQLVFFQKKVYKKFEINPNKP